MSGKRKEGIEVWGFNGLTEHSERQGETEREGDSETDRQTGSRTDKQTSMVRD